MRKIFVLGALLFALLMTGVVSATPIVTGSYSLSDDSPKAGSIIFYYVTVTNSGTSTAEDVEVRMVKSDSSYASTRGPGVVRLGDIAVGSSKTASFSISLGSTDEGVRRINSKIIYKSDGSEKTIEHDDYFTVESTQLEVVGLSSSDSPLRPGEISNLDITLMNMKNIGAKDFEFDFTSGVSGTTKVFKPLGGSAQFVSNEITEDGTITVSYPLYVDEGITNGVYDATLTVNYIGGGVEKTETIDLGIWVQGELNLDLASVTTDPTELEEGDENAKVSLSVQNIGQEMVKNLKVTFNPTTPFALTASTQETTNLGILNPSSSSTANYYVDIDEGAASGSYVVPVLLEYQDSQGKSHSETENITLRIKATPLLKIVNADLPEKIRRGDTVNMKLFVLNGGDKKAQGASVRVIEKTEQPFDYSEKSDNIGILEVNEEGQAVITFSVDSDATLKTYNMEFELRYTDGTNVYTKTDIVDVEVQDGEQSAFPLESIVIAVLVLIALLLFWKIRGGMRKSK